MKFQHEGLRGHANHVHNLGTEKSAKNHWHRKKPSKLICHMPRLYR